MDPLAQLLVTEVGLPAHLPQGDEVIPQHLPGKAVVLQEAKLVAVHHRVVLLVLQQHPHYGGLGHDGVDPLRNTLVLRQVQQVRVEAGAVVGPDGDDALLDALRTEHTGIHRQITALGMAAQPNLLPRELFCHGRYILRGFFLSGDLRHAGQFKVLFPAGQGIIGPPEGEVQCPVSGLDGKRGELLALAHIQPIHKAVQLHIAETPGIRHFPQHIRYGPGYQHAHVDLLPLREAGEEPLRRVPQGNAVPFAGTGNDVFEVHKGQLRQDQIVYLIEGRLLQGQISPPIQIIQQIRHESPPYPIIVIL